MSEKIQLSDHFTYKKLLQFTWPTIIMMIFTSIYGVVDGVWVSIIVAELLALILTVGCLAKYRGRYHYA